MSGSGCLRWSAKDIERVGARVSTGTDRRGVVVTVAVSDKTAAVVGEDEEEDEGRPAVAGVACAVGAREAAAAGNLVARMMADTVTDAADGVVGFGNSAVLLVQQALLARKDFGHLGGIAVHRTSTAPPVALSLGSMPSHRRGWKARLTSDHAIVR